MKQIERSVACCLTSLESLHKHVMLNWAILGLGLRSLHCGGLAESYMNPRLSNLDRRTDRKRAPNVKTKAGS